MVLCDCQYWRALADDKPIAEIIAERLSAHIGASADSLQKVKFGRGAVGKIAVITAIALLALAAIGVRLGTNGGLLLGVGVIVITIAALGVIFYILHARPELAVLEGAELIMYKHVSMAAKGITTLPDSPVIPAPASNPPQLEPSQEPEQ